MSHFQGMEDFLTEATELLAGRRTIDQPDGEGARTGRREADKVAVAATESTIRADTIRESRGDLLKEAA